jgi:hypothetical protein
MGQDFIATRGKQGWRGQSARSKYRVRSIRDKRARQRTWSTSLTIQGQATNAFGEVDDTMEIKTKRRKFARATETKTERGSRKGAQACVGSSAEENSTAAIRDERSRENHRELEQSESRRAARQGKSRARPAPERNACRRAGQTRDWAGRNLRTAELGEHRNARRSWDRPCAGRKHQRDATAGAHRKERACDTGTTREDARAGARLGHQGTGETPASSASCARRKQRQGSELGDTRGWEKGLGRAGMRP